MPAKAKSGSVYLASAQALPDELIDELSTTLEQLDRPSAIAVRRRHGPLFLYAVEQGAAGNDRWFEGAPRNFQREAESTVRDLIGALSRLAPAGHVFRAVPAEGGMVDWGFWPKKLAAPDPYSALHLEGYSEHPEAKLLSRSDVQQTWLYRGRRVVVTLDPSRYDVLVQVIRKATQRGYDVDRVVDEYYTVDPFPEIEAFQMIDAWRDEAKRRSAERKKRLGLETPAARAAVKKAEKQAAAAIAELAKIREEALARKRPARVLTPAAPMPVGTPEFVGPKNGGALYKYEGYLIELKPLGKPIGKAEEILAYPHMVSALVLAPDSTVVTGFAVWGGEEALRRAAQAVARLRPTKTNPSPRAGKPKRRSFMHRMLKI